MFTGTQLQKNIIRNSFHCIFWCKFYLWQVLRFLLFITISWDLVDAQIRMGSIAQSDSSWSPGEFFHDDAVVQITTITASIVRTGCDAKQSQLTTFFEEFLKMDTKLGMLWRAWELGKLCSLPDVRQTYFAYQFLLPWGPALFGQIRKQFSSTNTKLFIRILRNFKIHNCRSTMICSSVNPETMSSIG